MRKQHYTLSVIFIITVLLFTSCNKGNGELIYEGDYCYYKGYKEVYIKNTSFDKKITFTIERKQTPNDPYKKEEETESLVVTLNPGERKKIGCSCNGYNENDKWDVSYKIVGALEEKNTAL